MALYLSEADVNSALTMEVALECVARSFRLLGEGGATNSPRSRLRLPNRGVFNFMSAAAPGAGVMGLKAYGVTRGNAPRFYVQLFSSETGELLALIEAGNLGQIRTGAASGVATERLARQDAESVGVIGSGYQARSQLEAVVKARGDSGGIKRAKVFSRREGNREAFAEEMTQRLGIEVTPVASGEECAGDADVVITMTSASQPVLKGEWLKSGAHINAAGANHWLRRELDNDAVRRADVIAVDDLEQAKLECGDLIYPAELGIIRWEQARNLADFMDADVAKRIGRTSAEQITLFESQGIATQDIVTGIRVYELALERGLGTALPA